MVVPLGCVAPRSLKKRFRIWFRRLHDHHSSVCVQLAKTVCDRELCFLVPNEIRLGRFC
jgi:hypothetical protein